MHDRSHKTLWHLFGLARWTETDARFVLDAWSRSGLTLQAFAHTHGGSAQRLLAWHRRFATHPSSALAPPAPLHFVELARIPTPLPRVPRLELALPSGAVLRFEGPVDPDALRTVLAALREVSPC